LISNLKYQCLFAALISVALGSAAPERARAVTVEIAKKCKALTDAAYPLREPGNPAAGTTKGTGRDVQHYFQNCVANNGKADDTAVKQTK
jgi:hypothetical protein